MRRFMAVFAVVALVGCGGSNPVDPGESGTPGGNDPSNGSMRATINGSSWTAASIAVNYVPANGTFGGVLTILGTSASRRSVTLTVTPTGPGTYAFAPRVATNMAVADANAQGWYASTEYAGSTGSITFTAQTASRAAGSFAFLAVPAVATGAAGTMNVTAGTFDVSF